MSHQCSCGRDMNNNYVSYTNAYATASSGMGDRESSSALSGGGKSKSSSATASVRGGVGGGVGGQTQVTAKVMFGTVGAIKELREKEKSRHAATRASDRRN